MNQPTLENAQDLWTACEEFIKENDITCAETIYQTDWVIENAYTLIAEICKIVGYVGDDEECEE